jgi:hypothetical protein
VSIQNARAGFDQWLREQHSGGGGSQDLVVVDGL